jgi:hypothetical protein
VKITNEHLIDLARRETLQRAEEIGVVSGYLIGSVAAGNPLLGGTADIDLVLIHDHQPPQAREAVRLSHQIHLDICHHDKELYQKPSELRVHPWHGAAMCEPIFLYDPDHFFEWAQAGARGQFFRPDYAYARAITFLKNARQGLSLLPLSQRWLRIYLRAVSEAANAIACLDRFPAAGRRIALQLQEQAEHFDYPELFNGFQELLGGDRLHTWDLPKTLSSWARAYDAVTELGTTDSLPACRRDYYLHGFQALAENGSSGAILWPMLQVWERTMAALPEDEQYQTNLEGWNEFLNHVGLHERDKDQRIEMLNNYIDQNALWIEAWGKKAGA